MFSVRNSVRTVIFALAGVAVASSGVTGAAPVQAGNPSAVPSGVSPKQPAVVTLITGDQVTVVQTSKGASVVPKVGKGREGVVFGISETANATYVYPSDAVGLVAMGRLDPRLFDVTGLVTAGFDDSRSATTPLIVQQHPAKALGAVPGASIGKRLGVVNSTAVRQQKSTAGAFWTWLTGDTKPTAGKATTLNSSVSKVWLDGKVRPTLNESVPQVQAPGAWAAGYTGKGIRVAVLDTGIDETHLDLTGKVVARADFTGSGNTRDRHGHGTHLASIIAGNGARSAGTYKGVAPDAMLVNGKVLDENGHGGVFGQESAVIAGMEWAAVTAKARVVNVSLSGAITDGNDPMSLAVNRLSASTGALFVVSVGDHPYEWYTITSPGSADAALSVTAAEQNLPYGGVSWGPRINDHAAKPDMSAPGLGIVAARATDTSGGIPDNAYYSASSGTSAAAAHVSGAAALAAQRFPGWTAPHLKALLMSTSTRMPEGNVFLQGAGFLNANRAVKQPAWSKNGSVSAVLRWPHTAPVDKTITYYNDQTKPVTFNVAFTPERFNPAGPEPMPAGLFTVPKSFTVPAKSLKQLAIRIDPTRSQPDRIYYGTVHATAPGISIRNPVSIHIEPESYDYQLTYIDRHGKRVTSYDQFALPPTIDDAERVTNWPVKLIGGKLIARLPKGSHFSANEHIISTGHDAVAPSVTAVASATFAVTGPGGSLTIDTRQAKPVKVNLDTEVELESWLMRYGRNGVATGAPGGPEPYALVSPVEPGPYPFTFVQAATAGDRTYETISATAGQIPADPTYTIHDSELADVTFQLGAPGQPMNGSWTNIANTSFSRHSFVRNVTFPSTRRHLMTVNVLGEEVLWTTSTRAAGPTIDRFSEIYYWQAYPAGRPTTVAFMQPVFGPRTTFGYHHPTEVDVRLAPFERELGGSLWTNSAPTGRTSLRQNGKLIGHVYSPFGFERMTVPEQASPPTYTVELTALHHIPWHSYSGRVTGIWTAKTTGPSGVLPLLNVRATGPFDTLGNAPAGRTFPLTIGITGEAIGTVATPQVLLSYDDGRTWRTITMTPADGNYFGNLEIPDLASGHATLRVKARDSNGNAVDQTIHRAFGIKR